MKRTLWIIWFLLIIFLIYSPFAAPYNETGPWIFGIPYTVMVWFLLTLVCVLSVIVFALHTWRDW